jgi:hypothetical protein
MMFAMVAPRKGRLRRLRFLFGTGRVPNQVMSPCWQTPLADTEPKPGRRPVLPKIV